MEDVVHNLEVVRNKIADSAKGRDVTLVAVSKTKHPDMIRAAYESGQRIFGENKMQELREKIEVLSDLEIDWNYIGKLQSNKVKYIDEKIQLVQSIDSLDLLKSISEQKNTATNVLLQINIGREQQKNGFMPENLEKTVENLRNFGTIRIMGVMCIPPRAEDPSAYFNKTHDIFCRLGEMNIPNMEMKYLSMGMSGDFETAISCGSNMVRVGSSIFGQRL